MGKNSKKYEKKKKALINLGFIVLEKEEIGGQHIREANKIIPRKYDPNLPLYKGANITIAYLFQDGNIRRVRWEKNPELIEYSPILEKYFNKIKKKD